MLFSPSTSLHAAVAAASQIQQQPSPNWFLFGPENPQRRECRNAGMQDCRNADESTRAGHESMRGPVSDDIGVAWPVQCSAAVSNAATHALFGPSN